MRPVRLDPILNAHPYLRVERPPVLWNAEADDEAFLRLLGEMISAGLVRNGGELEGITLNVSNLTVEPDVGDSVPHGDHVSVTIRSRGDWSPEVTWRPDSAHATPLVNHDLQAAAAAVGAVFGYTRVLGEGEGSVTVFLPRAT
jgi:hypothetical protein